MTFSCGLNGFRIVRPIDLMAMRTISSSEIPTERSCFSRKLSGLDQHTLRHETDDLGTGHAHAARGGGLGHTSSKPRAAVSS